MFFGERSAHLLVEFQVKDERCAKGFHQEAALGQMDGLREAERKVNKIRKGIDACQTLCVRTFGPKLSYIFSDTSVHIRTSVLNIRIQLISTLKMDAAACLRQHLPVTRMPKRNALMCAHIDSYLKNVLMRAHTHLYLPSNRTV